MTIARYIVGFILSLVLTLAAYAVTLGNKGASWLLAVLVVLAVLQMVVQLLFFLHLDEEQRPRYKLWSFIFMAGTLLIIVVGSIWIMFNMNYNMQHMSPDQKNQYMMKEYNKGY